MVGATPIVDGGGNIWVSTGDGSVYSDTHAYDDGDSALELSPSLRLIQLFAPSIWAANNSLDLDMSVAPVLLPDGQVRLTRGRRSSVGICEAATHARCRPYAAPGHIHDSYIAAIGLAASWS
jgi:hypothetical protein